MNAISTLRPRRASRSKSVATGNGGQSKRTVEAGGRAVGARPNQHGDPLGCHFYHFYHWFEPLLERTERAANTRTTRDLPLRRQGLATIPLTATKTGLRTFVLLTLLSVAALVRKRT